jgi:Holliday junction resolvase RusA-like endonuclease
MNRLTFRVYGVALPKGNMRPLIRENARGMKIAIATESNRSVKGWQQLIAEAASHALQQIPEADRAMFAYGVRIAVAFYLPRPKKWHKRGVFVPHCTVPDVDKLARAVLDALQGVAYHDDKQVTELITGKYYAEVDGPAYADVTVEADVAVAAYPLAERRRGLPLFEATP